MEPTKGQALTATANSGGDTLDTNLVEILFSRPDFAQKLAERISSLPVDVQREIVKLLENE